jgi:hypothetical protein
MSTADPSLLVGFAGKVTNGPSRVDLLLGGRPRSFPFDELLLLDQADDTAGPCRRRARGFALDGVMADMGSSKKGCADCGVTAERGWGVRGSSCVLTRQRICCPDMGEAEYGVRFFCPIRLGADIALIADEGVIADAAVQGSWGVKNPLMLSG